MLRAAQPHRIQQFRIHARQPSQLLRITGIAAVTAPGHRPKLSRVGDDRFVSQSPGQGFHPGRMRAGFDGHARGRLRGQKLAEAVGVQLVLALFDDFAFRVQCTIPERAIVTPRGRAQHTVKGVLGDDDREHENHATAENAIGVDLPAAEDEQRRQQVEDHSRVGRDVAGGIAPLQKMEHESLENEFAAVEPVKDRAERREREREDHAGYDCARDSTIRDCDEHEHHGERDHGGQLDRASEEENAGKNRGLAYRRHRVVERDNRAEDKQRRDEKQYDG